MLADYGVIDIKIVVAVDKNELVADAVTALLLGAVQRLVCRLDDGIGMLRVHVPLGESDADGD